MRVAISTSHRIHLSPYQAVCECYGPADDGAEVLLWTLKDGGHTWPGGVSRLSERIVGKVNRDISASELMWEFFQRFSGKTCCSVDREELAWAVRITPEPRAMRIRVFIITLQVETQGVLSFC